MKLFTLFSTIIFLQAVSAHIILENPQPYVFPTYGHYNPLLPDGSDFPCKAPAGATLQAAGPPTKLSIGAPSKLSFIGDAVHGGGSCQLSLTKDFPPTKESKWMVIHSIEGGCPARNQKGNLPEGGKPDDYEFTVPEGIEPGDYVFAWTWVNRIGGLPEFYMNCAPVEVTAGDSRKPKRTPVAVRRAQYASLDTKRDTGFPPMFMANMGEVSGECVTTPAREQQIAIAYPNPGGSVERPDDGEELFTQECDGNPMAGQNISPPGQDESGNDGSHTHTSLPVDATSSPTEMPTSPQGASSTTESSAVPRPSEPMEPTMSLPYFPPTTSEASSTCTHSSAMPRPSEPMESTMSLPYFTPITLGASAVATSTSSPEQGCDDGSFKCIGGTKFQICTGGMWTGKQPIGGKSKCLEGVHAILHIIDPWTTE